MSLTGAAIKMLAEKGLSAHEIADVATANEAEKVQSAAAKRQARYRQRRLDSVTSDVTDDVTEPPKDIIKPLSSEANASGGEPPADPIKQVFDLGVALLAEAGTDAKQARSLIGKWRKNKSDAEVLQALLDCRARSISNPVEWIEKRFHGAKFVSATGHEYRGSLEQILREADRRSDNNTYWSVKTAIENERKQKAA